MNGSSKLVLGTVQFGCQYGINSAGRPSEEMVKTILQKAWDGGIRTLDTSSAYGDAESVLGRCIPGNCAFNIVSKYPKGSGKVSDVFNASLQRLGVDKLYGYLLHHFDVFLNDRSVWKEFRELRAQGKVSKIGFSLYSPEELELLLNENIDFDLLQFPHNIFDRKFDPYLKKLSAKGVEVHVRSTFLQGLFFKDRNTLPEKIKPLGKYLKQLDDYSAESGLGISELALNYNLQNPGIGGVLIGVDNPEQLQANLKSVSDKNIDLNIKVTEQELLNPVNWN